jgi:hypothetical protein
MPAYVCLYNKKGDPTQIITQKHLNYVKWSPNGAWLALGAFGNISSGVVEIHDPEMKQKRA